MHSSRMMSASTSATAHQAEDAFSPVGTNPHALPVNDVPPEDESSSAIDDDEHSSVQGSASVKSAKLELARKETKMVLRSRVVFCLFLGIVAVVTGIATHRVSVDVEDRDFETRFDDFARQVIEVSQINANNIFERYKTMGMQLTANSAVSADEMEAPTERPSSSSSDVFSRVLSFILASIHLSQPTTTPNNNATKTQ